MAHSIDTLRAKVSGLLGGLEGEVSLAVTALMPGARLIDALTAFQLRYPTVPLRLTVGALGAVRQQVLDGAALIGVGVDFWDREGDPVEHITVGDVELLSVAAPSHPLAQPGTRLGAAREHVQLVVSDRFSDLGVKHTLLLAGIGWGSMPAHMIEADIAAGRLVELNLPEVERRRLRFSAIYRTDTPPGPAGRWLIGRFVEQAGGPSAGE